MARRFTTGATLVTAFVVYAGLSFAAERDGEEPPAGRVRLFADSSMSVYERAVINLANLAINEGDAAEAVNLLEGLLKTEPVPEVASLVHLHLFRIRSKLLKDDEGAMKDAALVGARHIPQVLRELTWGLEREEKWAEILEVFMVLLASVKDSEAKVVTAEWLLGRMDRSGDDEFRKQAAQAVIRYVSPEEARAVSMKRIEEQRRMMEKNEERRATERGYERPNRPPAQRRDEPHPPPPSKGKEDFRGIPGF